MMASGASMMDLRIEISDMKVPSLRNTGCNYYGNSYGIIQQQPVWLGPDPDNIQDIQRAEIYHNLNYI
jgi:hypothetical protein